MKKYKFLFIFLICTSSFFLVSVLSDMDGLSIENLITSSVLGLILSLILYFSYSKRG